MSWFERDSVRFALEIELLRRHYPGVQLVKLNGLCRIRIGVTSPSTKYKVELVYPERFPLQPVQALMIAPEIRGAPHVIGDNILCIYHQGDYGPETTGKVYADWAMAWIERYEIWRQTGKWVDGEIPNQPLV